MLLRSYASGVSIFKLELSEIGTFLWAIRHKARVRTCPIRQTSPKLCQIKLAMRSVTTTVTSSSFVDIIYIAGLPFGIITGVYPHVSFQNNEIIFILIHDWTAILSHSKGVWRFFAAPPVTAKLIAKRGYLSGKRNGLNLVRFTAPKTIHLNQYCFAYMLTRSV